MKYRHKKSLMERTFNIKSVDEFAALLKMMDSKNSDHLFTKVAAIFGSDFLVFLEVFAGKTFKVPSATRLASMAADVSVWSRRNQVGFTDEAYEQLSDEFAMPVKRVRDKCEAIDDLFLMGDDEDDQ